MIDADSLVWGLGRSAIFKETRMKALQFGLVLILGLAVSTAAFAQQSRGQGGRGGFGGGGFGGFGGGGAMGGSFALLQDENVKKELDLVDEQVSKITSLQEKLQEDLRSQFQGQDFSSFRDLSEDERNARVEEMRAKSQKVTDAAQKQLDEILLPQQRERLKQIVVQQQLRRQGTSDALSEGELAEQLGITEEQKQRLADKQREVETALREKMEKLRQEAQDEVLSVLSDSQKSKLKQMTGEPITLSPPQFGGQGGPGGAGGRFGGARGGDGGRGGDRGGNRDGNRGGAARRAPETN